MTSEDQELESAFSCNDCKRVFSYEEVADICPNCESENIEKVEDENKEGQRKIVREAKVENSTIILTVPKNQSDKLRKEIRHILDSTSHNMESGTINYVDPDYDFKVVARDDMLEIIITGLDCTIWMGEDIDEKNVAAVCQWVLEVPRNVVATGGFELDQHYKVEAY